MLWNKESSLKTAVQHLNSFMSNCFLGYLMLLFQLQKLYRMKCGRKIIVNDEEEKIWKKVIITYGKEHERKLL